MSLLFWRILLLGVALGAIVPGPARAQSTDVRVDVAERPGANANFAVAEFRLWLPRHVPAVRAIVVLMPGSNGDGRGDVDDPQWQAFAREHRVALLGCRFTDAPHDQSFIEEYVAAARGSGQALLDAVTALAARAARPELAHAPLLLWGMSAGGQFNYELVAWQPDRVAAFVVNKGGIYYSALLPRAARAVPGLLVVGQRDLAFRTHTIVGLFAVNRRAGALWALVEEPGVGHDVGRSRELAMRYFAEILPRRVPAREATDRSPVRLRALSEREGLIGELETHVVRPYGDVPPPTVPTAWLPTVRAGDAWRAVMSGAPWAP